MAARKMIAKVRDTIEGLLSQTSDGGTGQGDFYHLGSYEPPPDAAATPHGLLAVREAHPGLFPNKLESARFVVKWGPAPSFDYARAEEFLSTVESLWDVMTGLLAFDQTRGLVKEKRRTHKMNVYITGTGLSHPGQGCYLGCDPEGVHFISTTPDPPTLAHELGHLAEMGTYGFVNNSRVGWTWESCSNWFKWYFYPDTMDDIRYYIDRHHLPLDNFETRYQTWFFFKYLHERFGPAFVGTLWSTAVQDELPFEVIHRVLQNNPPFADVFVDFASHTAAWDFPTGGPRLRQLAGDERGWSRFARVQILPPPPASDMESLPWIRVAPAPDETLSWFGFHVVDLKSLLGARGGGGCDVTLSFSGSPYPRDWRAMVVVTYNDGRPCWRGPEIGWSSGERSFVVSGNAYEVMLIVCPVGRHDDTNERPAYSFSFCTQSSAASATSAARFEPWQCKACTFLHEGSQSSFLQCAMCTTPKV